MRLLLPAIFLMLYASCRTAERVKPENFVEKEIVLREQYSKDFLCTVNMFIPSAYDTLLVWIDDSDCSCCESFKYRLTNSKSCLIQESGFLKLKYCKDNMDAVTIAHQCIGRTEYKLDTAFLHQYMDRMEYNTRYFVHAAVEWREHKIENINGREFMVLGFWGTDEVLNKPYDQVQAFTVVKNTMIGFHFQCYQANCTDFPKKAYQILQSIQIDTMPTNAIKVDTI